MTPFIEADIRARASIAGPTEAQIRQILDGWTRYFHQLQLTTPEEQEREFHAICRARVQAGCISIVADKIGD